MSAAAAPDGAQIPEEVVAEVRARLRRAAGQVQAVDRMLGEGRACQEVMIQLTAAAKALEQAGFRLLAAGLVRCIADPDAAAADGLELADVERMFLKLA